MNFDQAFEKLIGHEGGYVNDPADPGGETKYGISKRQYPKEDIKNLTLERAKEIYLIDYWKASGCELVPDGVKFDLFDMVVNSGVSTSIKTLQKAVGATPDGVIGQQTIKAIGAIPAGVFVAKFNGWRLDYLNDLPTWPKFGKGWTQRIAENLKSA